jgi:hypothetical protein
MMGNQQGMNKSKPLIVGGVPFSPDGATYRVTFEDKADHEAATFTESTSPNAYYLPWADGTCTEGSFDLNPSIKYFFTAAMTGCSLWVKVDKDHKRIIFVHEGRTDTNSQETHRSNGFTLIFDSTTATKFGFSQAASLIVDAEKSETTAVYFEAYAVLDYEHKVVEFRVQMIRRLLVFKSKSYKLLDMIPTTVPLPS